MNCKLAPDLGGGSTTVLYHVLVFGTSVLVLRGRLKTKTDSDPPLRSGIFPLSERDIIGLRLTGSRVQRTAMMELIALVLALVLDAACRLWMWYRPA